MNCKLEGILSANVTPFKDNCKLDEPGLRRLIRGTQRVGVRNVLDGIVVSKFARFPADKFIFPDCPKNVLA
jgi:hypothetical protein